MIWIGFIGIGSAIVWMINGILNLVNLVIPASFGTQIGLLIGKVSYFQALFPVDQLLLAFVWVLSAWLAVAGLKLIFGFLGVIPGVSPKLPEQIQNFNHKRKELF